MTKIKDITERQFKSALCRLSIAIPFTFIFAAAYCRTSLYYPESKTSVQFSLLISIYAGFLLLWENIVPMRFGCRGNRFEIFANLFPTGLLLMAVFSQYHPVTAVILLCVPAMLTAVFGIILRRGERSRGVAHDEKRHDIRAMRFFVTVSAIVFLVPEIFSLFVYDFESRKYTPDTKSVAAQERAQEETPSFLKKFCEDEWTKCSSEERITLIQLLSNYEAEKLGIPKVSVVSGRIDLVTLGYYDDEKNEIVVDIEHMREDSARDVTVTILHETYHAYQYYLAKNIDFNSEISKTAYFDTARSWRDNSLNYIDGHENREGYSAQPLEESARAFAQEEYENLSPMIEE